MDPGSSHAAIAPKGRVCGASARPPGRSSPPSSKTTTPLHSRLQPCSGWLAMAWAAARAISPADGHGGSWGHMPTSILAAVRGARDRASPRRGQMCSRLLPPAFRSIHLATCELNRFAAAEAPAWRDGPGGHARRGRGSTSLPAAGGRLKRPRRSPAAPDEELPGVLPSAPLAIEGPKSGLTGTGQPGLRQTGPAAVTQVAGAQRPCPGSVGRG